MNYASCNTYISIIVAIPLVLLFSCTDGEQHLGGLLCNVCPNGSSYCEEWQACLCANDEPCPSGYRCNLTTGACECDNCESEVIYPQLIAANCIEGTECDQRGYKCACVSDDVCGEGNICARGSGDCMCASDECCQSAHAGFTFDPVSYACVCVSDECCSELGLGSRYDHERQLCVCLDDESCPAGFWCDRDTGQCLCELDEACEEDQFCNSFGFCQEKAGCATTFDCREGQICDVSTQECIDDDRCTLHEHCPIGQICRSADGKCMNGCNTTGDCELGQACLEGVCVSNACEDDSYCDYEHFCDSVTKECYPPSRNYCKSCSSGIDCPADDETCLRVVVEGMGRYCAVACTTQADCPSGFFCGGSFAVCGFMDPCGSFDLVCDYVEILGEAQPTKVCVDPQTRMATPTSYACVPLIGMCQ